MKKESISMGVWCPAWVHEINPSDDDRPWRYMW